MVLKRRKLIKKAPKPTDDLCRMGDILAAGKGTAEDVETYNRLQAEFFLGKALGCIRKAEENRSWKHMDGCFKQASEIYVLASVLYEKNPEYTIMSDAAYDALARWLLDNEGNVDPDFWSWYNITAIDLKAGTGHRVVMQEPVLRMRDAYIRQRESDGHKPRLLRRPAKRGSETSTGGGGSPRKLIVRKAGQPKGDRKAKVLKRPKRT